MERDSRGSRLDAVDTLGRPVDDNLSLYRRLEAERDRADRLEKVIDKLVDILSEVCTCGNNYPGHDGTCVGQRVYRDIFKGA